MRTNKVFHKIIVSLFFYQVLFYGSSIFALPGYRQHTDLWNKCLGIEDKVSKQNTRNYFYKFSSDIDKVNEVRDHLRAQFGIRFKHRLLMHWGFNLNDPAMHKPFKREVENKLDKLQGKGKITSDEEKEKMKQEIFQYVKEMWIERNKSLIADTGETFGLSTKSNSLATIIYDIHILADYTDRDLQPLARLDFLVKKDLIRHGLEKFGRGTSQQKLTRETIDKILTTLKTQVRTDELINKYGKDIDEIFPDKINIKHPDQRKAVKILIILKQDFPRIIGKSFPKNLAKKGITVTYKKSVNDTVSTFVKKLF